MSENQKNDLLEEIWQTQQTHNVRAEEIAKQAASLQRKQRFYMVLDILSLSPFALLFVIDIKFSFAMYIFFTCIFASGVAMVVYFIKLRWYAAFGDIANTTNFTDSLMRQYKNNALIAKINKHVGWLSVVLSIVTAAVFQILNDVEYSIALKKLGIVTLVLLALGIPWCIWAHKRQKRFEEKVAKLSAVIE